MARIIAIDYGKKRSGIAVTDPLKIIATALETVETDQLVRYLKSYFSKEHVELILLGHPLRLDGRPNEITPKVEKFFQQLQKLFPHIPSKLVDERFTSKMATEVILQSGINKKSRQDKSLVDKISAAILLQGYLDGQT